MDALNRLWAWEFRLFSRAKVAPEIFTRIRLSTFLLAIPFEPEGATTREQAVVAYTRTAAFPAFADDRLGTLKPGKLADLAVLSQNIFKVPDTDLSKTESVLPIGDWLGVPGTDASLQCGTLRSPHDQR